MSPSIKIKYAYTATDSSIEIFIKPTIRKDSSILPIKALSSASIHLKKIKGGFIDADHSTIYVRRKDFNNRSDLVYYIDGKMYSLDMGKDEGYSLQKRKSETNTELINKLEELDENKFKLELVKGLDAYKRFGMEYVFGVIVITPK